MARDKFPQLMLMSKDSVCAVLVASDFKMPSYVMRGECICVCVCEGTMMSIVWFTVLCTVFYRTHVYYIISHSGKSALRDINHKQTMTLWSIDRNFRVKINCASYVNVTDGGKVHKRHALVDHVL